MFLGITETIVGLLLCCSVGRSVQRAKKAVSNSAGLVDFNIGLILDQSATPRNYLIMVVFYFFSVFRFSWTGAVCSYTQGMTDT